MEVSRVVRVSANQFPWNASQTVIYSPQQLKALLEEDVPKLSPDYFDNKRQQLKKSLPHLSEQDIDRMTEGAPPGMRETPNSKYDNCMKELSDAKMNFQQEALVLLRQTESSGSIGVWLETEFTSSKRLICKIQRSVPEVGTCDMAIHMFALIFQKEQVSQIELWADNQQLQVWLVSGK